MEPTRPKKTPTLPKTIPWEPYKGATSASGKGVTPEKLPPLIPYRISSSTNLRDFRFESEGTAPASNFPETSQQCTANGIIGGSKNVPFVNGTGKVSGRGSLSSLEITRNPELVEQLRQELEAERQLTAELKRLLVASMGDDLTCQIQALSEDKVRLASRMNTFATQSSIDHDRAEDLQILSDMWRCKFLAMSVRADELVSQRERLLGYLKQERQALENLTSAVQQLPYGAIPANVLSQSFAILSTDIIRFCERTPCDEQIRKPCPVTSNLTVACCKNCANHEIKLL